MRRRDKSGEKEAKRKRRNAARRHNAPKASSRRESPAADPSDPYEKIALLEYSLNEALEQQTATSEVLQVISSSPGDLRPVFETMLAKAVGICEAKFGTMNLYDAGAFHTVAMHNVPP